MSFFRSETPKLRFKMPISEDKIDILHISFSQDGKLILLKTKDDVYFSDGILTVPLSEDDTLKFLGDKTVEMQFRVASNEDRLVSDKIRTSVKSILEDGRLE